MKTTISILVLLLSVTFIKAQDRDSIPVKKDVTIHIVTSDSGMIAFKKIGMYLTDKGFSIAKSDPDFLSIRTDYKLIMLGTFKGIEVSLNVTARGNEIRIQIYNNLAGESIVPYYSNNSIYGNAWKAVMPITNNFPHQSIYYTK